jgi:TolB-like protein/DNA-binding winged helix-turn-helix (wHTH) protein
MRADFRVGDWLVRPERLCMDLPGKSVHITPKAMAVLECLVDARGQVVPRNDILDTVWPGAVVTDDVLTQCVVELRKAFDDSAQDPKFIETIPRKGFRLVAPVSTGKHSRTNSSHLRTALAAIGAFAVLGMLAAVYFYGAGSSAPNVPKTIAVIPFVSLSPDGEQDLFADGLTEEITYHLARLDGLAVTGLATSFALKGRTENLQSVAEELGVSYLVDGSVRRNGDDVRVTARLTSASSGVVEWSAKYDIRVADIFDVQQQIATAVADVLSVGLGVGSFASIQGGTQDIEAYEQYIAGNTMMFGSGAEFLRAITHYERAVEIDPEFAIAWAALAGACKVADLDYARNEFLRLPARRDAAIAKALSLAPDSERVLEELASVRIFQQDYKGARRILERIHQRYTGRDIPYSIPYLDLSLKMGRIEDAQRALESIRIRDPLNPIAHIFLAHYYAMANRIDEVLELREQRYHSGEIDSGAATDTVYAALASGRREDIVKWLGRADALMHDTYLYEKAPGEVMIENFDDSEAMLEYLADLQADQPGFDPWISHWAAYLGDDELALRSLRRTPDPWTIWTPTLNRVRRTEAFKKILIDAGIVDYWNEFGWGDFCWPTGGQDFECR